MTLVQFHRNLARSLLGGKRTEKEHAPRASEPQPATRGRGRGAEQPRPLISKNACSKPKLAITGKKLRLLAQTTPILSKDCGEPLRQRVEKQIEKQTKLIFTK